MNQRNQLSKKELEYFKELLLKERERILFVLRQIESDSLNVNQKEKAGELSNYSMHMADVATDNYNTDFRLGMATNEQHILEEIDAALDRIDDGSYGFCEKYNTPIPKARLKALPYTRFSIKAQEEEESKQ